MDDLANIAAKSVGSERCVRVEKFADGMFNKTFLLTMQDGKDIVGKVPNPNAEQPYYTTASEVATMDFVRRSNVYTSLCSSLTSIQARNVLGTPISKVLEWSSMANESPVGAEYITMEKAPGVALEKTWSRRFEITRAISRLQSHGCLCL